MSPRCSTDAIVTTDAPVLAEKTTIIMINLQDKIKFIKMAHTNPFIHCIFVAEVRRPVVLTQTPIDYHILEQRLLAIQRMQQLK